MSSSFQKFLISWDNEKGFCAIAKEDLEENTLVLLENSLIWAIDESSKNSYCHNCLVKLESNLHHIVKCEKCNYCIYCSFECKLSHWDKHHHEIDCDTLKGCNNYADKLDYIILSALRLMLFLKWWKTLHLDDQSLFFVSQEVGRRAIPSQADIEKLNSILFSKHCIHTPSDFMCLIEHDYDAETLSSFRSEGELICKLLKLDPNSIAEFYTNCTLLEEVISVVKKSNINIFEILSKDETESIGGGILSTSFSDKSFLFAKL